MDNFYTRHNLAAVLQKFTDGESRVIGTIKFTNVDGTNRYHLSKAMELMKDAPRGSWRLVQAYHKHPNYEKLQRDHSTQQRHLQPAERQPFVPPFDKVADCCGFIVSGVVPIQVRKELSDFFFDAWLASDTVAST